MMIKRTMKLKNEISNRGLFYHETYSSTIGSSLFYSGLLFLALAFILRNIAPQTDGAMIGGISAVALMGLGAIVYIIKTGEGYALEEDGIYYKYMLSTRKLLYKDIKCIIIVNSCAGGRIKNTPCVVMMGGEPEKILHFCMNSERFHVLSMDELRERLGEEIGYYGPENCWKIFRKGAFTISNYGFEWNKGEMHKVLKGFSGDYYVAASVIDCWRKKYDEIVKEYGIDEKRIHIMDDSTYGIFRWQAVGQ